MTLTKRIPDDRAPKKSRSMRPSSPGTRRASRCLIRAMAATIALAASSAAAQQGEQPPVFGANVELVTLSVSVLDAEGVPVNGLRPEDFIIHEDGEERETAMVLSPESTPLDIALLLDLSNSMRGRDWRERAEDFLRALSPGDCVFLLGFSTDVGGSVWAPPDDEILADALDDAVASGGTALFDALLVGLRELERSGTGGTLRGSARAALNPEAAGATAVRSRLSNPCPATIPSGHENDLEFARRKAIVVVSDGVDSTSENDADAVLTAAQLIGVPLFPVEIGEKRQGVTRLPRGSRRNRVLRPDSAEEGVLRKLADLSGGKTVSASGSGYDGVLAWLRGSYLIGYYTPTRAEASTGVDFTRHEVEVELRQEGFDVIHRPAYYRPTVDTRAARFDVDAATNLMAQGELEAALLLLHRAIRADPAYSPAYFRRALAYAEQQRVDEAHADALRAVSLAPGVPDLHELAMMLSIDIDDADLAWDQAIRAALAGADLRPHFARLEDLGEAPPEFNDRVRAPKILVARPYAEVTNLLMETALTKVMRTVRVRLAASTELGVVVDPSLASYVMTIRGNRLGTETPRRFLGEIRITDTSGKQVFAKDFVLENVDSDARRTGDLARLMRDIENKLKR